MVDHGHDPERFYHCDCVSGGYTAPCEECADLAKQNDRYERALREILEGKRRIDIESPLGVGTSMAGRFIEIAKRALQAPGPTPKEET